MLNFILPILKNPLTRIIADKTVGAIQHKLEKDKIIKAKEIEAIKTVNVEQIKQYYVLERRIFSCDFWFSSILLISSSFTRLHGERLGDTEKCRPTLLVCNVSLNIRKFWMNLTNKLKGKK